MKITRSLAIVVVAVVVVLASSALQAQTTRPQRLQLSTFFSDHMVLQRGADVPVWGTVVGGKIFEAPKS